MKSARHTIRQHVVPHTPGAIGPVTGEEAGANLRAQLFIVLTAPTARPCQPGIEAAPRDTERLAYAGGAGVAISLLYLEYADHIHLNDLNRSVYAFWKSVCEEPDALCKLVRDKPLTVAQWKKQK